MGALDNTTRRRMIRRNSRQRRQAWIRIKVGRVRNGEQQEKRSKCESRRHHAYRRNLQEERGRARASRSADGILTRRGSAQHFQLVT